MASQKLKQSDPNNQQFKTVLPHSFSSLTAKKLRQEYINLENMKDQIKSKKKVLQNKLREALKECEEFKTAKLELENAELDLQNELHEKDKELNSLRNGKQELKSEISSRNNLIKAQKTSIAVGKQQVEEAKVAKQELQIKYDELSSYKDQINEQLQQTTHELQDMINKITELKTNLKDFEEVKGNLFKAREMVTQLEHKNQLQIEELDGLKSQVANSNTNSENKDPEIVAKKLEEQLAKCKVKAANREQEIKDMKREIERLEQIEAKYTKAKNRVISLGKELEFIREGERRAEKTKKAMLKNLRSAQARFANVCQPQVQTYTQPPATRSSEPSSSYRVSEGRYRPYQKRDRR